MRALGLFLAATLLPFVAYAASININTADASLLDTLPGIGPTKAAAIIDYRTKNGPFIKIEDIQNVSGIGPTTFANIQSSITVGTVSGGGESPQPPVSPTGSHTVQAVEPITSTTKNAPVYEEIEAPAAANELAGVGAPLSAPEPVAERSRASGLFSVWTLGLLGVIVVAGAVFILL
jgi:competence protein ComEA